MATLKNYDELNEIQMDVLREIGNIGSGNAASALSSMLARVVNIEVPVVKILDYAEVMEQMGGPETMIVGLLLSLEGDVSGMIMFLLHQDFAHMAINTLIGEDILGEDTNFAELDEMGFSAIQEVANIMAGSYVNAISAMTDLFINITPPDLAIDMLGAILSVPAIHYANISDKIIFIEDKFSSDDVHAPSHILLIPDMDSLEKIMTKLGIDL